MGGETHKSRAVTLMNNSDRNASNKRDSRSSQENSKGMSSQDKVEVIIED
jgi:hypothetical protein